MSQNNNDEKSPFYKMLRPLTLVSQLGYTMLSPIGAGLVCGYFFDKWLDCSPWGIMFFTLMGIGGAYKAAFTSFKQYTKDNDDKNDDKNEK